MTLRALAAGGSVAILAALALAPAGAQDDGWTAPMTAWGEPDLQGKWPVGHLTGTPLERPEEYGDREFLTDEEFAQREEGLEARAARYDAENDNNKLGMGHWAEVGAPNRRTSLIVDPPNGRLPALTAEGQARSAAMHSTWQQIDFDWVDDFDTWDRCITRGMPASMFPFQYNNGIEVFQSPGQVVLNLEMVHETRVIPTDGRDPIPSHMLNWMGESRGTWEGDTLVVETTNLMPGPSATNVGTTGSPRGNNMPVSENTRIVERFTRTGPDTIDYEMTFTDPTLYEAPWTAKLGWVQDPDYEAFEYACHEGQYMVRDYINASRASRAAGGADE